MSEEGEDCRGGTYCVLMEEQGGGLASSAGQPVATSPSIAGQ